MSTEGKSEVFSPYQKNLHRFGKMINLVGIVLFILVPLVITITEGVKVDFGKAIGAYIAVISMMGIMTVVEFASYYPLLGTAGTYLTFLVGNTINMRLPAAMSSLRLAGYQVGTKEGELISTLAIAMSTITSHVILLAGMIGLGALLPVLSSPSLAPAFANLMPALMGSMGLPMLFKDLKTTSLPAVIAAIFVIVMGYAKFSASIALTLPLFIIIAVLWRFFLYKLELKKGTKAA